MEVVDKAEEPSNNEQIPVADSQSQESAGPTGFAKGKPLMEEDTSRYQLHILINCYLSRRLFCLRCNAVSGSTDFKTWKVDYF